MTDKPATKTEQKQPRQQQQEDYAVIKGRDYEEEVRKGNITLSEDSAVKHRL